MSVVPLAPMFVSPYTHRIGRADFAEVLEGVYVFLSRHTYVRGWWMWTLGSGVRVAVYRDGPDALVELQSMSGREMARRQHRDRAGRAHKANDTGEKGEKEEEKKAAEGEEEEVSEWIAAKRQLATEAMESMYFDLQCALAAIQWSGDDGRGGWGDMTEFLPEAALEELQKMQMDALYIDQSISARAVAVCVEVLRTRAMAWDIFFTGLTKVIDTCLQLLYAPKDTVSVFAAYMTRFDADELLPGDILPDLAATNQKIGDNQQEALAALVAILGQCPQARAYVLRAKPCLRTHLIHITNHLAQHLLPVVHASSWPDLHILYNCCLTLLYYLTR